MAKRIEFLMNFNGSVNEYGENAVGSRHVDMADVPKAWLTSRIVYIKPIIAGVNPQTADSNKAQAGQLNAEFAAVAQNKSREDVAPEIYAELKSNNDIAQQELERSIQNDRENGIEPLVFDAAAAGGLSKEDIDAILWRVAKGDKSVADEIMWDQIFPNCVIAFRGAELKGCAANFGWREEDIDLDETYFIRTPMRNINRQMESGPFWTSLKKRDSKSSPIHSTDPLKLLRRRVSHWKELAHAFSIGSIRKFMSRFRYARTIRRKMKVALIWPSSFAVRSVIKKSSLSIRFPMGLW